MKPIYLLSLTVSGKIIISKTKFDTQKNFAGADQVLAPGSAHT